MSPNPTPPTDVYLAVPLGITASPQGAAQVYIVEANDMDEAAQAIFNQGFDRVAVVLAVRYENPIPPEP